MSGDGADALRRAWTAVLGVPVDDGDDFFALGGDSLRAVSVVAQLRHHLGVVVDPGWLYDYPRFVDARASLVGLVSESRPGLAVAMVAGVREGDHPLSHQQEGLLAVIDRVGAAHRYQVAYAVAFPSRDAGRFRAAVTALAARHPALRTTLHRRGGRWVQHVDDRAVRLEVLRAGHDPVRVAREWVSDGFGLEGQRLARIALVDGDGEQLLVLVGHQLVLDPWSWGLVLRELSALYDAPEGDWALPLAYSDYARWQREWVDPVYARHLEFWRRQVEGYPPEGLPLPGAGRQVALAGPASVLPLVVPACLTRALRATARAWRAPVFHVLLSSFSLALARWAGVRDVLIGSATANRTLPGTDEVVGFFVNGRITRVRLTPCVTFAELTGRVGESWRAADAHDQAHLEKTVVDLGVPDMVNVKFSYNEIPTLADPLPTFGGAPPRRLGLGHARTSRRHVSVALAPDGHRLTGALTYRTDVLDAAAAAGLIGECDRQLRRAAESG